MELLELVNNLQTVLEIDDLKDMPNKLLAIALSDDDTAKDAIVEAVGGDLSAFCFSTSTKRPQISGFSICENTASR